MDLIQTVHAALMLADLKILSVERSIKAGTKGNRRRLQALDTGKMARVVGAARQARYFVLREGTQKGYQLWYHDKGLCTGKYVFFVGNKTLPTWTP